MLVEFVFVYLLIDVFCATFSIVIYTKITIDSGTEREVRALRGFIIAYIVFLIADAIWCMGTYDTWMMTEAAAGIIEAATLLIMGVVAYFWFLYVEYRIGLPYTNSRWFPLIAATPIIVTTLLYATTRFTGLIYTIGPDASFIEGPLALLPDIFFLLYGAFASVHALVHLLRETSSVRRREIAPLIWFPIPPVLCGILDLFMHGMPVMALSVFASVLLVFMNSQDSRINTDALTGLNNRRRASEYIEDSLAGMSEGERFGVFMIDVDYFKDINDANGHGEGDRALQIIAEGLRRAMDGHHGLAARWGGDEFLIAAHLDAGKDPEELVRAVQSSIDDAREANNVDYRVSVSVGYAIAQGKVPMANLIAEADRKLYEQKTAHHAALNG